MARLQIYNMTPKQEEQARQDTLSVAHKDYKKGLNSYAFFKVHNKALSEDLVQDVFIKTWKFLVKGGKIDVMRAFLYHVLNGLIIDEYRKRKPTSLDVLMEKGFEPSSDDSDRLLNLLDGKAAILLIKQLPEKYREVMNLRYVQMLSTKEIALITHQSRNTVTVQAYRGLNKLKTLYNRS